MTKHFFAVLMALLILSVSTVAAFAEAPVTNKEQPYTEHSFAYGTDALEIIEDYDTRGNIEEVLRENDLTVVSVSTTTAYFKNEMLADGTYNRRPMSKSEALSRSVGVVETSAITNPDPKKCDESKLTISLTVSADARHQLWVLANANWGEFRVLGDPSKQQAKFDDTCEIIWGGNGELMATNRSISGRYTSSTMIPFYEYRSNPSQAYGWTFEDLSTGGTGGTVPNLPAKYINASVTLSAKNSPLQGKTTDCTFKYTHTYNNFLTDAVSSWTFEVVATGLPY